MEAVWRVGAKALRRARRGDGPAFLHFVCVHPEGHFLGDPLLQIARQPGDQIKQMAPSLLKAAVRGRGASVGQRVGSLTTISRLVGRAALKEIWGRHDPLVKCRKRLKMHPQQLETIAGALKAEIETVVANATGAES